MTIGNSLRALVLLSAALLGGLGSEARAAAQDSRVEARDGDRCLACDAEIGDADFVLLHRGRRVPMHAGACEEHWNADTTGVFAKLQPRGALFQEAASEAEHYGAAKSPWFWLGVYMLAGLVCAAASAYLAVNRAQAPLPWFFAGLVGNVAALAVLVFIIPRGDATLLPAGVPAGLAKVPTTRAPRPCNACGTELHPSAAICSGCGVTLTPLVASEVHGAQ